MNPTQKKHIEEAKYNKKQRAYENRTSWRFFKKLQLLSASSDYQRKLKGRLDMGEIEFTKSEAACIVTGIWLDLKMTTNESQLAVAAWILRSFVATDLIHAAHSSIRAGLLRSYAEKENVSVETARKHLNRGIDLICTAARGVLSKSKDHALADFRQSLLSLKCSEEIDFQYSVDDDVKFFDQYVRRLLTLIPDMEDEVMYQSMYNNVIQHISTLLKQKKLLHGDLWYRNKLDKIAEPIQQIIFLFEECASIRLIKEHLLRAWGYGVTQGLDQEALANQLFLEAVKDIKMAFELQQSVRTLSSNKRSNNEKAKQKEIDSIVAEATRSTQLDLAPLINDFLQAVYEERYNDAKKLYCVRLEGPLRYQTGNYHLCIKLLQSFLPNGVGHPIYLTNERDKTWVLNAMANLHRYVGDPRVVPLYRASIKINGTLKHKLSVISTLYNLGGFQLTLGQTKKAKHNLRCGLKLSYVVGDDFHIGLGHQELGLLDSYTGASEKGTEELRNALFFFRELENLQSESVVWQYFSIHDLLAGEPGFALLNAQRALSLTNRACCGGQLPVSHDLLRIRWLLGWSLVSLAQKQKDRKDEHLAMAEGHLKESLAGCHRTNLVELEPNVLLAWARWHCANGDTQRAHESAEQALTIASRCGYRLNQAEIHNFLARLALDEGDQTIAKKHAEIAKKYALCDGPDYCYRPALEEACHLIDLTQKV
jgi:tetratricopeptide (TPR) repeat protein